MHEIDHNDKHFMRTCDLIVQPDGHALNVWSIVCLHYRETI